MATLDDRAGAGHTAAVIDVEPEQIQRHLQKVLLSESLAKAETPRKLLSYLTERALRDEIPKETEIAFDVFGKDPSFSGAEQSIVRVSVRSLRQKLAEYYAGPGQHDEVRFDIPKGGYRLTASLHVVPSSPFLQPSRLNSPRLRHSRARVCRSGPRLPPSRCSPSLQDSTFINGVRRMTHRPTRSWSEFATAWSGPTSSAAIAR